MKTFMKISFLKKKNNNKKIYGNENWLGKIRRKRRKHKWAVESCFGP